MRRTPYIDKFEQGNIRSGRTRNSDPAVSFRAEGSRLQEDNFMSSRPPANYIQPRIVRPLVHRPLTTQKINSLLDYKKEGSQHVAKRESRDLFVNTLKQSQDSSLIEQSKGRLYRGSSWRYDQKITKEFNISRYHQKRDSMHDLTDYERRTKKTGAILDLIGQNLKKSETNKKQDEFFEYIMRFSYRTRKGYIPTNSGKVNQDAFIINPNINGKTWQHFFAVCDGHGPLGHHVSGYIKNSLPNCVANAKNLEKHPKEMISRAFEASYEKLLRESGVDMSFSGSTVISCYLQQNKLICANVGDSRAILGRSKGGSWEAIPLSIDHKPTLEKQAERIRKMKGRVQAFKDEFGESIGPLRVWVQNDNVPGLAMTRSFGDLVGASVGVSPIPEIKQFSLSEEDKILVIGSDGVFEFLSNEQVIRSLVPFYETKQIQQGSDHLLSLATKSWTKNSSIIDDITFILIFISYNEI